MTKDRVTQNAAKSKQVTAVAASEDSTTEGRVHEFCRGLERLLGSEHQLVQQQWLVSELRVAQLRTIAATEAAQAKLVIISLHNCENLAPEIETWIEEWLGRKDRQTVLLVALLDPVHQGFSPSLRAFLQSAAQRGNMDFLTQVEERPVDC